ncbi:glycosyltransferase [Thalassotalea euphylliae]|uniref:glycosyltransferase n=1 Tax=Thalassotalea euphylliae TaxID=1655234 RepID=UPI0011C06777|nr:glycosyltransferase [Thalassotalea euphylliae]
MRTRKLLIIQPYLTQYRLPVFRELAKSFPIALLASESSSFGTIEEGDKALLNYIPSQEVHWFSGKLMWQKGVLKSFLRMNPDKLFITANPRYLSSWCLILLAKMLGKEVFLHGQGRYNKSRLTVQQRLQFWLFSLLSKAYICYTESCKSSLRDTAIYKKSAVAENSIANDFPVKKKDELANGIFFVGRLRRGCNLTLLLNAVTKINAKREEKLIVHVIGSGENLTEYRQNYHENTIFYGEVYDQQKVAEISQKCFAGCYPGDAGLSVLHYMSLSLVPIVHEQLDKHMGPEPSYISSGVNGLMFKRNDEESLIKQVEQLLAEPQSTKQLQQKAFNTYIELTKPSLGQRLAKIISGYDSNNCS